MIDFKERLIELDISFAEDVLMRDYTTFRIGGPCPLMIHCSTRRQLQQVMDLFHRTQRPFLVIGEGSNLLVSDRGLDIPVIRFISDVPEIHRSGNEIEVSAATRLDEVVAFSAREGLAGLIYASGIPGTLAGAIVGNAGAFGSQIGDVVKSVVVVLPSGEERILTREQLHFGYRHSILKEMTAVVVSATLALRPGDDALLMQERNDILDSRRAKHPDYRTFPCAGSFFKNIVHPDGKRQAAGWFLDQTGCKALSVGDAGVFDRHANIIINRGKAKALEVYQLSEQMKERVRTAFQITLEPEVKFIGDFS